MRAIRVGRTTLAQRPALGVDLVNTTFGILGETALLIDGRLRESWGRPRERAVLATLLVHAGRWVSIDTLIEWAWSEEDEPPRNPAQTFYNYATRIRKWLERLPSPSILQPGNSGYRLHADRHQIDYHQFRTLITEAKLHARGNDPKRAVELAEQALGLWRGRPLDGLTSKPALAWRRSVVQNQWIPAQVTLLQALLDIEEFDDALVRLDDLQIDHPLDISLAKLRLSALHSLARHTDATSYFFATRRRLLDENADEQAVEHLQRHHESFLSYREPPRHRPLRSNTPPRQLPHDIVDFVGRADLLTALDAATSTPSGTWTGGVIVLDGTAGVGKTALAIRWAHRTRHRFRDGDLYVNLNGFADSPKVESVTVVDDFLAALGHPSEGGMSSRSKELLLRNLLADKQILVLLDNARDTEHIRELVPLLSNCIVLVTSRQRLSSLSTATGARRVRADPMPVADVSKLLSRRLLPHREINHHQLARIAPLCDGLPLTAILLAEHLATRPDAELSEFVDNLDRQQLIAEIGGHGDGPGSLHTFFGWSYHALATPEKRLFRLLGLHPGPDLSIETACACDGRTRAETVKSLSVLVAAHLIEQPEAFDRYRFHDLLREFAADRAHTDESATERQAAMLRYTSFYLSSATNANRLLYPSRVTAPELPIAEGVQPIVFTDPAKAKQWFDRERSNLVAATGRASELGYYPHVWRLAHVVTTHWDRCGWYADSRLVRELALLAAHEIGDREAEMSSLVSLGKVHVDTGDHVEARRHLDAALRLADEDGHDRARCTAFLHLGRLEMLRGDLGAAVNLYQQALDIARRSEDHEILCWNHCQLGEALLTTGDLDQALFHMHHAQWFAELVGDESAYAYSLNGIGSIYRNRGDFDAASTYCKQALTLAESIPDLAVIAQVCVTFAEVDIASGALDAALVHAGHAVDLCRQMGNLGDEARAHDALGHAYLKLNDAPQAVQAWRSAIALYTDLGNQAQASRLSTKIASIRVG